MTTTSDVTINAADWTEISDGSASVTCQLKTDGPCFVAIASDKPAANASFGFLLDRQEESSITLNDLVASDKVYAKSKQDDDVLAVAKS